MANPKILIVENTADSCREIEQQLTALGYTVCASVSCGSRAIENMPEMPPDLVMVYIGPKGAMAAVEAAEEIYYQFNLPVILLIDSIEKDVLERIKEVKVFGIIFKPFAAIQLSLGIEQHLDQHRENRANSERIERLSSILNAAGQAIIVTDQNGLITFMNPVAKAMTGWETEEVSGKLVSDILGVNVKDGENPIENSLLNKAFQNESVSTGGLSSASGVDAKTCLIAKSGREIPIDYNVTQIKAGMANSTSNVITFHDITKHETMVEKLTQSIAELRHQTQLMKTVFDSMYDGIVVLGLNGEILFTNPSIHQIFGSEPPDSLPSQWSETYGVFYPDKETPAPMDMILSSCLFQGEAIRDQELFVRNKEKPDGIHIRASAIPLFDENQEVVACVCVIRDILRPEVETPHPYDEIVAKSRIMHKMFELIQHAAESDISVLVSGESGTGKELVARAIHLNSSRKAGPFVSVNCAAIPETLIETEFFGHERGAFTGAAHKHVGKFEYANGGTIFFDEIGDMQPAMQAKLLRVLQERQIQRVGGKANIPVDVRVLTATNQDLEAALEADNFRRDLYYRIAAFPITVPPLKDRREDIPLLANHFVKKYADDAMKPVEAVSAEALRLLTMYDFPGNVRELENIIKRAVLLETTTLLQPNNLPSHIASINTPPPYLFSPDSKPDSKDILPFKEIERNILAHALEAMGNNVTKTAQVLKISRTTLYRKLKWHHLIELD